MSLNKINPQKLFLIDGLGALLSAFLLGVILVKFENIFGMPRKTLYFLAFLPCVFAIYDLYSYLQTRKNQGLFLKIIATANLAYCFISIGAAFHHRQQLTSLGWIYFLFEILIIIVLVIIELKVAARLK